mmetsp:Transcript_10943/g.38776  ORF Transcript_10943/g.38776 Transcript_10943/m.38776 type:complete len:259 (-) Transcript_10943:106-882(-)
MGGLLTRHGRHGAVLRGRRVVRHHGRRWAVEEGPVEAGEEVAARVGLPRVVEERHQVGSPVAGHGPGRPAAHHCAEVSKGLALGGGRRDRGEHPVAEVHEGRVHGVPREAQAVVEGIVQLNFLLLGALGRLQVGTRARGTGGLGLPLRSRGLGLSPLLLRRGWRFRVFFLSFLHHGALRFSSACKIERNTMGAWEFNCGACRRRGFDVSSPPSFVGPTSIASAVGRSGASERRDKGPVDSCVALVAQEPFLLSPHEST